MSDGGRGYGKVMGNAPTHPGWVGPGVATDYGSEDEAGKRERRRQKGTPATLTVKN